MSKETSFETTASVARRVGVTVWTLYDLIRNGVIPSPPKVGKSFLWGLADVRRAEEYAATRKEHGG